MAQVINTNIASLNAQNNLNKSQSALQTALSRLSSGMRINSAKDDAAGLAIAERFSTQIRGLNQAARNANDAVSLTQTAEGAMNEIVNNLQRIRELAVQSLNASNSAVDRGALDAEVQQLKAEIDRVAQQTSFNGVKLIDGTFSSQVFQVGANAGETISVSSIASMRSSSLGAGFSTTVTGGATTAALTASALTLNGVAIGASVAGSGQGQSAASAFAIAQAINAASGTGVSATANSLSVVGSDPAAAGAIAANTFSINGVNVGAVANGVTVAGQGASVAAAINLISASTGVSASAAASGAVTLTAADGRDIVVAGTVTNTGLTAGTTHSTVTLTSTGSAGITVAGAAGAAAAGLGVGPSAASQTGTALSLIDVTSVTTSNVTLATIDSALATVNTARGAMGAYQNRFASTIANIQTTAENLTASRSRIQDADFAAETANLTRAQILQQAGTAMLAQANAIPNNVLTLLRG
jgi:flagellin